MGNCLFRSSPPNRGQSSNSAPDSVRVVLPPSPSPGRPGDIVTEIRMTVGDEHKGKQKKTEEEERPEVR